MLRRRLIAGCLCVLMAFSVFTGCGGNGKGKSAKGSTTKTEKGVAKAHPDEKGVLVQNMAVVVNPDIHVNPDMWIFKQMEKKFKMNFNIEVYTTDQWNEKKSLLFAANELPDVLIGSLSPSDIITYSKAKQIIPIDDLLEKHAPNYTKELAKHEDGAKVYAPDGKVYGMSSIFTGGAAETPGARAFINAQWAKTVGKELPHTYQDFYDLLVAFRDNNPKGNGEAVIPLSGTTTDKPVDAFVANPLGIQLQMYKKSPFQVVDGKVDHLINMPIYKEYLTRMKKLYDEKLLDNEYYTQNIAQFRAKGANMQLGAYTDDAHFVNIGSTDPKLYGQYDVSYPLTSEYQKDPVWYGDVVNAPNIFLTSTNKHPDKTIEYLDYFWTEGGAELLVGPEKGKWDGEGGIVWNADKTSFTYDIPKDYNGIWDWLCKKTSFVSCLQGNSEYSEIKAKEKKAPEDAAFKDQMEEKVAPYVVPNFPTLFFTDKEQDEITLIMDDATTYFDQEESKMVMGEVPIDSGIKDTKKYLDGIGLDKLIKVYQAAYDRYETHVSK